LWHTRAMCPDLLAVQPWMPGTCKNKSSGRCEQYRNIMWEAGCKCPKAGSTNVSTAPAQRPRANSTDLSVAVYITTAGSEQHIGFLECQADLFRQLPRLSKADVIMYVTPLTNVSVAMKEMFTKLLEAWPQERKTIYYGDNLGKQKGAMKASHDGFSSGWFDSYDWVIRINPDVVIHSESKLFSKMDNSANWGVFASCDSSTACRDRSGCIAHLRGRQTHTDFYAVRPGRIGKNAFANWASSDNAERQATSAFAQIFNAKADAYIVERNRDAYCRVRGGGVWHSTGSCPDLLALQPWTPGVCKNKSLGTCGQYRSAKDGRWKILWEAGCACR